jgi:sugar phosphate permease
MRICKALVNLINNFGGVYKFMDAQKRVMGKDPALDAKYKRLRLETFIGIFIGYAGYYLD